MTNFKNNLYSKQGLWTLFLMCSLPIHFWTLLLAFRDISWLTERSNLWDAIGVLSYGMVFAFFESLIIFMAATLLGFLISAKWDERRRVALLSVLVLIVSLWAMYGQAHFIWGISLPEPVLNFMAQSGHPYRYLFGLTFVMVALTVAVPAFLVLRRDKVFAFAWDAIDRLSLLASVYLAIDVIGLIIVVIRNV